ncbi:hypothetical protein ANN_19325 [Periplaneta americana]|uniref:Uncharacterized protein n=1 Tax=Periplaneta americana TaxID=6978 RepID=A0ABQ8S9N0_PERAM|nr:hypothetical protein ANN_19325 [Periplaneta americana]
MASLCEGGNEPPGSLKASNRQTRWAADPELRSGLGWIPLWSLVSSEVGLKPDGLWRVLGINPFDSITWLGFFRGFPPTKRQMPEQSRPASTERNKERVEFWGAFWLNLLNLDRLNVVRYIQTVLKLRCALREKRPGKIILQHNNAWPHTERVTVEKIRTFGWETLPHSPYSPDLEPTDYHLFGSLKEQLRGQRYETLEDIRKAVRQCLQEDETDFYSKGIFKLSERRERKI